MKVTVKAIVKVLVKVCVGGVYVSETGVSCLTFPLV
jgi:hypothetical protein